MIWSATGTGTVGSGSQRKFLGHQVVSTPWLRSDGIEAGGTAFILPDHSPTTLPAFASSPLSPLQEPGFMQAGIASVLFVSVFPGPQHSTWHISTFGESKLCPTWGGSLSSPVVQESYRWWSQFFIWETQRSRRQSHKKNPGTPFAI